MYKLAGACYPGEVLALMGPSGSGKTSLLSVIGGRTPKQVNLEGEILYNNARLTKTYKRSVGYVLQVLPQHSTALCHTDTLILLSMPSCCT